MIHWLNGENMNEKETKEILKKILMELVQELNVSELFKLKMAIVRRITEIENQTYNRFVYDAMDRALYGDDEIGRRKQ